MASAKHYIVGVSAISVKEDILDLKSTDLEMELKEKELEKLDAIILVGGLGTRLRMVIDDRPKVLAPINNRPFLDIILDILDRCNFIGRIVLATGYMSEKIIEEYTYNRKYSFEISFSIEDKLLGTGGGIKKALSSTTTNQVLASTETLLWKLICMNLSDHTMKMAQHLL